MISVLPDQAAFILEMGNSCFFHILLRRGGRIHHFCNSQFTCIQKLTVMIQFNSIHFSWCSKETRFPIPNYICIEVNSSSMILTQLAKLEQIQLMRFIHISSIHLWDSFAKCCKYIPFAHLPHLLSTFLANQLQIDNNLMLLALQTVAFIFNEIDNNVSFTSVIILPLSLRRQLA